MIRHEQFVRDEILPSWFVNRLQDRIATLSRFRLTRSDATTVKVAAAANDAGAALNVQGLWRFVEADVTRAHPGGAAGTYLIFATAKAQAVDNVPDPNTDHSDYAFALSIVPNATTPPIVAGVVDVFRRVGRLEWDGAAITRIWQEVGAEAELDLAPLPPVGAEMAYAGTTDPDGGQFVLADGRLIDRTVHAEFFAKAGHAYNGGVDPGGNMVRIPDKRGRASVGADDMGTAQGAAGRLPNSNRVRGQAGGVERVTLTVPELPSHAHPVSDPGHTHLPAAGGNFLNGTLGAGTQIPGAGNGIVSSLQTAAAVTGISIQNAGGGGAHTNMQPYEVGNVIVRVK